MEQQPPRMMFGMFCCSQSSLKNSWHQLCASLLCSFSILTGINLVIVSFSNQSSALDSLKKQKKQNKTKNEAVPLFKYVTLLREHSPVRGVQACSVGWWPQPWWVRSPLERPRGLSPWSDDAQRHTWHSRHSADAEPPCGLDTHAHTYTHSIKQEKWVNIIHKFCCHLSH